MSFLEKIFKWSVILGCVPLVISFFSLPGSGSGQLGSSLQRFSTFDINVNQYARTLGFIGLIAFFELNNTKKIRTKLVYAIFITATFILIMFSGSRSALLATAGSIMLFIVFLTTWKKGMKIIFAGSFCVAITALLISGISSMSSRISSLQYMDLSIAGRLGMWLAAWQHRWDSPIFGVGTGNFASILPSWAISAGLRHPHNVIVECYIEWGVIGLIALIGLFVAPIITWWRCTKKAGINHPQMRIPNFCMLLIAFAFVVLMTVASSVSYFFYIPIGLLNAACMAFDRERENQCTS